MDKQGWGRSLRFVEFEECKRAEPTHVCKMVFETRFFSGKFIKILPAILNHAFIHHAPTTLDSYKAQLGNFKALNPA